MQLDTFLKNKHMFLLRQLILIILCIKY